MVAVHTQVLYNIYTMLSESFETIIFPQNYSIKYSSKKNKKWLRVVGIESRREIF